MNKSFPIFMSIVLVTLLLFSTTLSSRLIYGNGKHNNNPNPASSTGGKFMPNNNPNPTTSSGNSGGPQTGTDNNPPSGTNDNNQQQPCPGDSHLDANSNKCLCPDGSEPDVTLTPPCPTQLTPGSPNNNKPQSSTGSGTSGGSQTGPDNQNQQSGSSSSKTTNPAITPYPGASPGKDVSGIRDPITGDTIFKKADGTEIREFPNGNKFTSYPDDGEGGVRHNRVDFADGSAQVTQGGNSITYLQSGDVIISSEDGKLVTHQPDGTVITQYPRNPGIPTVTKTPDGNGNYVTTTTLRNGDFITDKPDKTVISYTASTGTTITAKTDGTKITENKDGSWYITYPKKPNGSVTTYYSDGRTVTH
jgi:hypothetical protein